MVRMLRQAETWMVQPQPVEGHDSPRRLLSQHPTAAGLNGRAITHAAPCDRPTVGWESDQSTSLSWTLARPSLVSQASCHLAQVSEPRPSSGDAASTKECPGYSGERRCQGCSWAPCIRSSRRWTVGSRHQPRVLNGPAYFLLAGG